MTHTYHLCKIRAYLVVFVGLEEQLTAAALEKQLEAAAVDTRVAVVAAVAEMVAVNTSDTYQEIVADKTMWQAVVDILTSFVVVCCTSVVSHNGSFAETEQKAKVDVKKKLNLYKIKFKLTLLSTVFS